MFPFLSSFLRIARGLRLLSSLLLVVVGREMEEGRGREDVQAIINQWRLFVLGIIIIVVIVEGEMREMGPLQLVSHYVVS